MTGVRIREGQRALSIDSKIEENEIQDQSQSNEDEIINEDDHYEGNFVLTYDYHDNDEKIIHI